MEITHPKLTGIIAGGVLLLAAATIWKQQRPAWQPPSRASFIAAGQVLAAETAKAIHDRGQIVAVLDKDDELSGSLLHDQWQAFQKELQKHPDVHVAATEVYVSNPNDEPFGPEKGCPGAAFKRILENHAQADAIVFFIELPDWRLMDGRHQTPAPVAARIIALDAERDPVRKRYGDYFANGLLSVLVRAQASPLTPGTPKTPREWIDQHLFKIYTPQNYESLSPDEPGRANSPGQ